MWITKLKLMHKDCPIVTRCKKFKLIVLSYPSTWYEKKKIAAHRLVMGFPEGKSVDHINHDVLDNRKENLRHSTHSQNLANSRIRPVRASSYRGVYYSKEKKKWRSYICINYKTKFLGYLKTQKEAAIAYNKKAKEIFREFSNLNKIR